jgi:hypothetical protein
MIMDNFYGLKKAILCTILFCSIYTIKAQENNIQKELETKFKENYKVELYKKFPSFPKLGSSDSNQFLEACRTWIVAHPEYNDFLNTFKPSTDKAAATKKAQ